MHDARAMPKTKTPELIGSREACALLGIDKSTLSRWVAAGKLNPAYRAPGTNGAMVFNRDDIDALVAA